MWDHIPLLTYFHSTIGVSGALITVFLLVILRHARGLLGPINSCLSCFCHSDIDDHRESVKQLQEVVAVKNFDKVEIESEAKVNRSTKAPSSSGNILYKKQNKPLCSVNKS